MKLYLCWASDQSILGVATNKKMAMTICNHLGDAFNEIEADTEVRETIDTTKLCTYHVVEGFLTYEECKEHRYSFEEEE